jgi:Cu2+-exporting ATPase
VHALLVGEGLDRYYELRGGAGTPATPVQGENYLWLERDLDGAHGHDPSARRITLDVQGVHCAACVWLLQSLYHRRAGALDIRINPALGKAELVWCPSTLDLRGYLEEAGRFGYRFGPNRKQAATPGRALAVRLGISVAAAMNTMIFSWCFYLGLAPTDGLVYAVLGALTAIMATIAVAASGWVFFRSAFQSIRSRVLHLDVPIALGLVLAYGGSVVTYFRRGPEFSYFDTVATFAALMLVGRWLQGRLLERNRQTLLADDGVDSLHARRVIGSAIEIVPAAELRAGDRLVAAAGELIPVRTRVLDHPIDVSLDWITGESAAVPMDVGSIVPAGAFNAGDSSILLEVVQPFTGSVLRELLELGPKPAAGEWTNGVRGFWSRFAAIYVVAVLGLAAIALGSWLVMDPSKALAVTVATLVVTCPCAIGLATPLARELVYAALKRKGVFLRNEDFLDRALAVRKILFDKTGTLTLGRLEPTEDTLAAIDALDPSDRAALREMTAQSNHPIPRALSQVLRRSHPASVPQHDTRSRSAPTRVRELSGVGIEMTANGVAYRLGRSRYALPAAEGASADATIFSRQGLPLAMLSFRETVRTDAIEECDSLRTLGFDLYVLTGDREARALDAAERLGIPRDHVHAALGPAEKAGVVRALDRGDTLMVGDGINDSPSFGEALCSATPAVDRATLPSRSDFYFLGEGIAAVRRTLLAARQLRRVTRGNLVFTTCYNAGVLAFCLSGHVTPLAAAIVMPVSSAIVVLATAWHVRGKEHQWMS